MTEDVTFMGEKDKMRVVLPTKSIVDFDVQTPKQPFAGKDKFVDLLRSGLGEKVQLPPYFPDVPDIFKARQQGVVIKGEDSLKALFNLPPEIFDCNNLLNDSGLRVVVEEIILAYEKERKLHGLPIDGAKGGGWSTRFLEELDKIKSHSLTPSEVDIVMEDMAEGKNIKKKDLPLKGEKIA